MNTGIRIGRWFATVVIAAAAAVVGCQPDEPEEAPTPTETAYAQLPAMSGGTLQELGPHRYTSTIVTRYASDTASRREERQELVWQDMHNYRYEVWLDGELHTLEYRQGNHMLRRHGAGSYHFATPTAGTHTLTKTMIPGDVNLAKFRAGLVVEEAPVPKEDQDPDGKERRLYTLALHTAPTEGTGDEVDQKLLAQGHSGIPVTLDGHALVDGLGNRLRLEFDGSYRKRKSGSLEAEPTLVTGTISRQDAPDGLELHPPAEAAVLFFEKQQESRTTAP